MSNYIEYNDTIAFHPGYYIKEIVEESGLTQEDFAAKENSVQNDLKIMTGSTRFISSLPKSLAERASNIFPRVRQNPTPMSKNMIRTC